VRRGGALLALATALLAAGCGTGGISKSGDTDKGKTLFLAKCAGCHTLAAAGSHGTQGPNLDDAFAYDRRQGFKQVTIEQVVRDQIELAEPPMPANLVTGTDADDVAAYVALVAGRPVAVKSSTNGKDIFTANCGSCHTLKDAGTSGTVGPNLDQLKPNVATVEQQVRNGGGGMPSFEGRLSNAQIAAVSKYVAQNAGKVSSGGGGGGP
jgi:cbb3-type cytochrome c oxidase subunit III